MTADPGHWLELARSLVAGRKVIIAGGVLAGCTGPAAGLLALGADAVHCVVDGLGTGALPEDDRVSWVDVVSGAQPTMIAALRATERAIADPVDRVVASVDRFDPEREALSFGTPVLVGTHLGDRPLYGPRRPEWVALEDKTTADALFDRAGVARLPSRVVPVDRDALATAAAALDAGDGTVWSGDGRDGFNGGAVFVKWVRDDRGAADALAWFHDRCDRVRVSPFAEGIPGSIHGFVVRGEVACFRPVEALTLRSPTRGFTYAGCATYWDPPDSVREDMREAARRVGRVLHAAVGYGGTFTVDGVVTVDGFVATECNPRFGAGMNPVVEPSPEVAFVLLHHAAAAGERWDFRLPDLEAHVVERADATRGTGGAGIAVDRSVDETTDHPIADLGVTVQVGPGVTGAMVRVRPDPGAIAPGPPFAPLAAAAYAEIDASLDLGLGPLTPATDRSGG